MPDSPNKLSQFWQELKRRKVVRVITVYAAAAFVILELLSIIIEPLRLPDWTLQFAIVFLCIGFIVAIILSWIYDIHPEGGVVKTKPVDKVKKEDISVSSKGWKIASYISFVVIVGLIVLNIIPRTDKMKILDTSIAVLPLVNLSSNDDISSIGFTNEIIMELQNIKVFSRVLSLTSTMQFEEHQPTISEIGQILNVNYIIEGTIQKQHDKISIIIQVISAKEDDHIWAEEFEDAWENRFNLQDDIAFEVAKELQIILSPSEKERIEKIPTTSVTARDLYQRGWAEQEKYWLGNSDREALERAENLYYQALDYDSTFAQAYAGLALVYYSKHRWEEFFEEDYLDSMLILADIALSFDDQLAEAYVIRGGYFEQHNRKIEAINEYNKAIQFNPNYWGAYWRKGQLYIFDDLVQSIDNFHKAALLQRNHFLPDRYQNLHNAYAHAGFKEKSIYYLKEALKLDDDSSKYYRGLAKCERFNGNFEKSTEFFEKSYAIDSTDWWILSHLGRNHMELGHAEESLEYYKKYERRLMTLEQDPLGIFRIGHAYLVNGFREEAQNYFNTGLEIFNDILGVGRHPVGQQSFTFYDLASIYSLMGDKDKAYGNLRLMNQRERMPLWMIKDLNNDPLFDSIRDEPEFQQIVRDVEAKYQAEHERVRQWLEENEML